MRRKLEDRAGGAKLNNSELLQLLLEAVETSSSVETEAREVSRDPPPERVINRRATVLDIAGKHIIMAFHWAICMYTVCMCVCMYVCM